MRLFARFLTTLTLLFLSPFLLGVALLCLCVVDLAWFVHRPKRHSQNTRPSTAAATVVIPTWNGRDLLERNLPSVVAALQGNPANEIIVVDNASTDGSSEFVRKLTPQPGSSPVRLLAFDTNKGFGGGSNAGIRAARNDIVVLLNNDMRVDPRFLRPLLDGFSDEKVFAVSCQIFFNDPHKLREETGLTQGWWENGSLRVRHRIDERVTDLFPCFYGGGGSCAFDRRKFLDLGGFDPLLDPFYLEDADIGYLAWKRGWKVLYQPRSIVHHEHRGTIGKLFSSAEIQTVLGKNFVLFSWKNIHEWRRLVAHFFFAIFGAWITALMGESHERASARSIWRAFRQLPQSLRSRWAARTLAVVGDTEAFLRPMGGYFRDRFVPAHPEPQPLRVLFVSPYPIFPPIHGGAVFMYQTLRQLTRLCEVHLIALLDDPGERAAHEKLGQSCSSAEFLVRLEGTQAYARSIAPYAVREFAIDELRWMIHRKIFTRGIDVLQLEYAALGQYAGVYQRVVTALFEHDVYFQSVARGLRHFPGATTKLKAAYEYLRALRYEMRLLPRLDRIQVCSRGNKEYLLSFAPRLAGKIQEGLRAGIDTADYRFQLADREPNTLLFLGSFRHQPNRAALDWLTCHVLPRVFAIRPKCRLLVVGSGNPPPDLLPNSPHFEMRGFAEDIREPLSRYTLFLCPILSGSGVRVKLLEAFASGIPVVSTRLGAEGLATQDGQLCALADEPGAFADKIVDLLDHPEKATEMARRARAEVEAHWNMPVITTRLVESYRQALREKRATTSPSDRPGGA